MREIKFRAKRIDNGEWVYGNLIYNSDTVKYFIDYSIVEDYDSEEEFDDCNYGLKIFATEVIPESIGQYTGLTDKNSKEIYEGDRIKTSGDNIFTIEFIGSGYFCKREDGLIISLDGINRTIEVIGTIFDKED